MSVLKYGAYTHANTPVVRITLQRLGRTEGNMQAVKYTWDIEGSLIGTGADPQADLKTKVDALDAAYADDGSDLVLYRNDGITVLQQLTNVSCLDGTKVTTRPSFPKGEGSEFATARTFSIQIQGDVIASDAVGNSGNSYGEKTEEIFYDQENQKNITRSGRLRGVSALADANAEKLVGYLTVRESQNTDADTGEVSYNYSYIQKTGSRTEFNYRETVTKQPQFSRPVFLNILGGGNPVKQTTVETTAVATQEGEAESHTGYPSPATCLWAESNLAEPKRIIYESPKRFKNNTLSGYKTRWSYRFEFVTDPVWHSPNNPPS